MILAIDDEPIRYESLNDVIVSCRRQEVAFYLNKYKFDLICLDFDMPFVDGEQLAREFLIERNIPVCIVTLNEYGRNKIKTLLDEYEVPNFICPALQGFHEDIERYLENLKLEV